MITEVNQVVALCEKPIHCEQSCLFYIRASGTLQFVQYSQVHMKLVLLLLVDCQFMYLEYNLYLSLGAHKHSLYNVTVHVILGLLHIFTASKSVISLPSCHLLSSCHLKKNAIINLLPYCW